MNEFLIYMTALTLSAAIIVAVKRIRTINVNVAFSKDKATDSDHQLNP